jgi:hypothetical protein
MSCTYTIVARAPVGAADREGQEVGGQSSHSQARKPLLNLLE